MDTQIQEVISSIKKSEVSKTEAIEFSSLSAAVQAAVREGIESAKAGKILTNWGDFTQYIDKNNE